MKVSYALLTILALSVLLNGCKRSENEESSSGGKDYSDQSGSSPVQTEAQERSLREYFPLEAGRSWTYMRTVKKSEAVCYYATQNRTQPYKASGREALSEEITMKRFVVLCGMQGSYPPKSEETYTITGERDGIFWKVRVEGTRPRDGRYSPPAGVQPNVRWGYQGKGVNERTDGVWLSFDDGEYYSEDHRWLAILMPNSVHSDPFKKAPRWAVAATIAADETLRVPAGIFSDCLKNVTMIHGKNITDVLFRSAAPTYASENGFTTISYYVRGIGLVQEIQYDVQGQQTYLLELKTFKK